ncbi:MAG: SIR2 family protein [Bacteroidetes bacterium]|nr:SIR2 family protein [Bacteroidota bacterium]
MDYQEIKRIIESCHLNFLVGSGASKPFFSTLNQIESVLTELNSMSFKEIENKTIIEASVKNYYFQKCIRGNLSIQHGTGSDYETAFNNYMTFVSSLYTILTKRRSNLVSKQVNLFTSNMDLFFDWSLEKSRFSFNDGFAGRMNPVYGTENFHNTIRKTSTHYEYKSDIPLFNLFKLHGSVNWKLEESQITYDNSLSILKDIDGKQLTASDCVTIEKEVEDKWVFLTIGEMEKEIQDKKIKLSDSHKVFLDSYSKLVMINPTKQKFETTTRDLTFYELLRMYSNHLERENSVLFVFGFSFSDEHIREITKRVANANPTLIIIIFCHDIEAKASIEKILPVRHNIKFICDSTGSSQLSLDEINKKYFMRLASELAKDGKQESNEESTPIESDDEPKPTT